MVNSAVPGALVPIETRFAAPVALIFQLASVKERLAEVFPSVKLPEYEPVPIFIASLPSVFTLVVPAIVAPPVAVRSPPSVRSSQSVAVVRVCVESSLFQYPTVPVAAPVISPLQTRSPVALSNVHPVLPDPPATSTLPVEVAAI